MADFKMDEAKVISESELIAENAAFNDNKDVAVVSDASENDCTGAAYIYTLRDGVWLQTARLATEIADSQFGSSVSINGIGDIAVISSWNENNGDGAVYIYTLIGSIWTQSARLASGIANSQFGWAIHINSIGDVVTIAARTDSNTIIVYNYDLVEGVWTMLD